jgi:hypothetical protein
MILIRYNSRENKAEGFMERRIKFLSVVIILVGMMSSGIWIDGYSQEKPAIPAGPVVQQQPTTQQPYMNPRTKNRGLVVAADLNVTPLTYTGTCPAVFTLKGQIYANKPMTVLYKIVRSDNVPMEPIALTFEKEERKEITYTWQIGDPGRSTPFNEWALIEAVYPLNTKVRSKVVYLKGGCGNQMDLKQQAASGQQEGKKGPPAAQTGFPGLQPQGKGPVATGLPMTQPGQQKQLTESDFPVISSGQGGQAAGGPPIPQPGQTGQGTGGMPMIQPGQKGPIPGGPSLPPGNGKGPAPGNLPVPQPDSKTLQGTEK